MRVVLVIASLVAGLVLGFFVKGGIDAIFHNNKLAADGGELGIRTGDIRFDAGQLVLEDILKRNRISRDRVERSEIITGEFIKHNKDIRASINRIQLSYDEAASGVKRVEEGIKLLKQGIYQLKAYFEERKINN